MVHKKYIKIKGKKYGPYYYESYREDGKVKKRYVKNPQRIKVKKSRVKNITKGLLHLYFFIVLLLVVLSAFLYISPIEKIGELIITGVLLSPPGASSAVSGDANLTIWDSTDLSESRFSGIPVDFFANYTQDSTGNVIDDVQGLCQIHYNFGIGYGAFQSMTYNSGSLLWEASNTFFYKGNHEFEVDCTSALGNVLLINGFLISNSEIALINFMKLP